MNHIKCSSCGKEITKLKDENEKEEVFQEVESETHFDISRSKKDLYVENGEIEEDLSKRNEKMSMPICKDCFLIILNESKTLGNIFLEKDKGRFIF